MQSTMGQRIASKPSGQLRSPESVDMLCASVRGRGRADSRASARLHRTRDEEKEGWRTVAPREAVKMSRLVHPAGISSQRHAREEYSSLSPFYLLSLCFSLLSLCVTIAGHRSAIASTRCLVARENESLPLLRTSRGFSLKSTLKIDRILCLIRFGILESMIQRFILTLELRMINVKFIKMTRCFCNYLRYISDEIMLILSLYTFIKKNTLLYRTVFKITAE